MLQVNYRGSTGYGRDYTNTLDGTWGVYDVEDAVSGAGYLAEQEWVDGTKLVIMGGSAGGYTVLQALVNRPVFQGRDQHVRYLGPVRPGSHDPQVRGPLPSTA